jgi:hypothetical protein
VRIFEALFWNVRDRLADRIYSASLVYPESRQVELLPGYYRNESRMFLALPFAAGLTILRKME